MLCASHPSRSSWTLGRRELMQKRTIYLSTALLAFVTLKLAWIASLIPSNPRYLLNNWTVVVISATITLLFFWRPFLMRWIIAPYFILTSLGSLSRILESQLSLLVVLGLVIILLQFYAGIQLIRMERESEPIRTGNQNRA